MGFFETLKDVATLVQKTDNIDLMKHVLELQAEAAEIYQENARLRTRVTELERELSFAKELRFEAPFYYAPDDKIPFCARCWETDRAAIHLKGDWDGTRWECFRCTNVYLQDDSEQGGSYPSV
jgi:hypothetical protein